jgi:cobalt-zinc-cadmium resistance protein CzcA
LFNNQKDRKRYHLKNKKEITVTILLFLFSIGINAQIKPLSLSELKQLVYDNNINLKALNLEKNKAEFISRTPNNYENTQFTYNYFNDKITEEIGVFNTFGISQSISLPSVYKANKAFRKSDIAIAESSFNIKKQQLNKQITKAYHQFQYAKEKESVYRYLDSLYRDFSNKSKRKFELGATNYLESILAKSKQKQIKTKYRQASEDVNLALLEINKITQIEVLNVIATPFSKLIITNLNLDNNIGLSFFDAQEKRMLAKINIAKKALLPNFNLQYNYGVNSFLNGNSNAFQIGVSIPIKGAKKAKIEIAKMENEIVLEQTNSYKLQLTSLQKQLTLKLNKYEEGLLYYQNEGKSLSHAILETANKSFKHGEIDIFQYIQSIETGYEIELLYLENLNQYNKIVIEINHIIL